MFDVFYSGTKPNLFAHEQAVDTIEQAQQQSRTRFFWFVNYLSDYTGFDFLWEPVPWQAHQRHAWPSQHQLDSGTYLVPTQGYTETNYHTNFTITRLPSTDNWQIPANIDVALFDFSWHPNYQEPLYEYHFGTQWQIAGGPVYKGPHGIKLCNEQQATALPSTDNWQIPANIESFDYSWHPNPLDPPYVYEFATEWHNEGGPVYTVPGATAYKYVDTTVAQLKSTTENWAVLHTVDKSSVHATWAPHPKDPPYIYVFGNQHWPANIMPTVEYHVPGATERKFLDYPVAILPATADNWQVTTTHKVEVDYSWCPDPGDPPYIYVFGNQWHPPEIMSTVEYHMPGATERKFIETAVATILPDQSAWTVPEEVDASNIDYSWIPDPGSPPYIYHFGTDYQDSVGLTYTVPGATELKFAGDIPTVEKEKSAVAVLDIFFMDRSNAMSNSRFEQLKERYPNIQKIRYVNSVMSTIQRCANKTKTSKFWVIGSENDYTDFDFAWHAQPWQSSMTHVFGSQWNKWSDTFLVNKWEFERNARWAKGIEEFPNLNFVQDQQVLAPADAHDIYIIEHNNSSTREYLEQRYRVVRTARYFDNYLDTLRRLLTGVEAEHVWVVSSLCDYARFDFSWQPEAWQSNMLHVFPSNDQKFGDTFYVPVAALQEKINEIELLDWFETVNYCTDQTVPRWPMPVIQHDADSHVDAVLTSEFVEPLALFTNCPVDTSKLPTVSIWREKTKTIVPLDSGAGSVIVPKNAISSIKTQLYDYSYIDRTRKNTFTQESLDIVFISNGEPAAEDTFMHLQNVASDLFIKQKIHRVDGVNGRVAAYHAAASASNTPWFLAVFAKLFVNENFDWDWQPDRMQQPKHYIFHALNPVNGLEYGHQAMIAYNKQLVLNNTGRGLDFTLDDAHEVVPMLSGTAVYNMSPWVAWRTAFREAIKLKISLPDVENEYRLTQWLSTNPGSQHIVNEQWSRWGAEDAVEYFDEVAGEFAALKKSYEWDWLASYAFIKRNLTPDQQ